jgi:hypothetical protein
MLRRRGYSNVMNKDTVTINITKGAAGEATAAIVRSELMSQGSINAQKKRHEMEENLALVSQQLAKITKVSSGAIASQGIYHLGSDIHAKNSAATHTKGSDRGQCSNKAS